MHIGGAPNAVMGLGEMVSESFMERISKQKSRALIHPKVCVCVGAEHGRMFQEAKGCKCLEWP